MTAQFKKILAEALSLSPKERATLAENILCSLDQNHSRLARECAKLNPTYEQALAEEGILLLQ